MEFSSEQHLQEMATDCSLEDMIICTKAQQERKPRPQQEQALKCPRCDSTNTKFCYYNNYSLTQPRYFCKSCRRYWTNGGTLRNIPVGGGCRKNKRPSSSKRLSSTTSNSDHHLQLQPQPHHHMLLNSSSLSDQYHTRHKYNPLSANFSSQMSSYDNDSDQYYHDHQPAAACSDLSLVFARLQKQQAASGGGGYIDDHHPGHIEHNNNNLSLLGNYSNSHVRNLMGLSNISDGQISQFQNNSTNFQNLYNGGFGSNSCIMSNISGDQMMRIPCEDYLGISSSSFGTPKTAGVVLLKQEDYSNNIHHNNVPRSSQILWGGAAAAERFPWHQINVNGHDIVDHSNSIINNYNMVDNADLAVRENMNVFAAAAPVWQGLINSPLL